MSITRRIPAPTRRPYSTKSSSASSFLLLRCQLPQHLHYHPLFICFIIIIIHPSRRKMGKCGNFSMRASQIFLCISKTKRWRVEGGTSITEGISAHPPWLDLSPPPPPPSRLRFHIITLQMSSLSSSPSTHEENQWI